MVNVTPRRKGAPNGPRHKAKRGDEPWRNGDPDKKIGLNTPIPEPLMLKLDWLIENKIIFSKASFIREAVEKAAEDEISRAYRVREAVKRIEAEDKKR